MFRVGLNRNPNPPRLMQIHPVVQSHPQSSRTTFGTPINTDLDNKKATTLFREIFFNPVIADSVEHIQKKNFPINSLRNPPV